MRVLLLTGAPGVGKTTVLRKVAEALRGWRLAGFYTEEIRVSGQRRGFRIVSFDGQEEVMAHIDFAGPHRVGKYGVDVSAIDSVVGAVLSLKTALDAYLVDEIGKMECMSGKFIAAMRALLTSNKPVVATIALRGHSFIDEVKTLRGVELWKVTRESRDFLPAQIVTWLEKQETESRDSSIVTNKE